MRRKFYNLLALSVSVPLGRVRDFLPLLILKDVISFGLPALNGSFYGAPGAPGEMAAGSPTPYSGR